MSKEEFMVLIAGMKAVYTSPSFIPDENAIKVWFSLLNDMDYKQAALNLQHFMQTETRYPMPADLRRSQATTQMSEAEAWALVYKALQRGIYYAKEEFEKLPPEVQKAVGRYEQIEIWAKDSEFNEGVISSNFKRTYRTVCDRAATDNMVSPRLRAELNKYLALEGATT